MIKPFFVVVALLFSAFLVQAAPPNPHTFVPNRGIKPSIMMVRYMKVSISNEVRKVVYVWNHTYNSPTAQLADLMYLFKTLSDAPKLPKQMLETEELELQSVLDTGKMIRVLDHFQTDTNQAYHALFEYLSLIVGTKKGDMDDAYEDLFDSMRKMIKSYNQLAQVTNEQYRKKLMPYYNLDFKK